MTRALSVCLALVLAAGCADTQRRERAACGECPAGTVCDHGNGRCVPEHTDAGSSDAGPPDAGPDGGVDVCEGRCTGDRPVCDPATRQCVRCSGALGCSAEAPVCDSSVPGGTCVRCTSTAGCSGDLAWCDTDVGGGRCVECIHSEACGADTPVCDPATRRCTGCASDADCPEGAPVCDDDRGQCVRCTAERGCSGAEPACDVSVPGGVCVECTSANHCGGATPACDTTTGSCVGCVASADCGGDTPVCDPVRQVCATCTAQRGCPAEAPVCDTSVTGGRCVRCSANTDCAAPTPYCDEATGACIGCRSDLECGGATPLCDSATRTCQACVEGRGCPAETPICATQGGANRCIACASDEHCDWYAPVCDRASGACVECLEDSHCDGGICDAANGRCVNCTAARGCAGATPWCDTSAEFGLCVQCTAPQHCGGATPHCSAEGTCVACLANAHCGAAAPVCGADGRCHQCATRADCASGEYCPAGACVQAPETCADAQAVAIPAGAHSVSFTVDTRDASDDLTGGCNTSGGGAELVYRLPLAAAADVQVTARPAAGSDADPVLYLRAADACASGPELSCADSGWDARAAETVRTRNRTGDVFIVVESYGTRPGPVDVTVQVLAPTTPPANDSCAAPLALRFDASGVAEAEGDTDLADNSNGTNDATPSCSPTAQERGQDVVFSYALAQPRDVLVAVTPVGGTPTLNPVVYVRRPGQCGSGAEADELACGNPREAAPVVFDLRNQAAGEYFLWVDGFDGTSGRFQVRVEQRPPAGAPANDQCGGAEELSFVNGVARASGDTFLATTGNSRGAETPRCGRGAIDGADVVYSYTLAQRQDVVVKATPAGAAPSLKPVLYVRPFAQCADETLQLGCAAATAVAGTTLRLFNQPAGRYALWLDSASAGDAGRYSLEVALQSPTAPPANDSCAAPVTLQPVSGASVSAHGDTLAATNGNSEADEGPTCSPSARDRGADLVYRVPLAVPNAAVSVIPEPGSGLHPVVYVRSQCDSGAAAAELADACEYGSAGAGATLTLRGLAAADYYVWVDGAQDTGGPFRIAVSTGTPANDLVSGARPLAASTATTDNTVVESTSFATDNYSLRSSPPYTGCSSAFGTFEGPDVVYAFTAPLSKRMRAVLRPSNDFDAALVLLGAADPGACRDVEDVAIEGGDETLEFDATAGSTYYLVVDGYTAADDGGFSLRIE